MVYRSEIEKALDEMIADEAGMKFQGLAVVLAKQKWPQLVACERKWHKGLDAHGHASKTTQRRNPRKQAPRPWTIFVGIVKWSGLFYDTRDNGTHAGAPSVLYSRLEGPPGKPSSDGLGFWPAPSGKDDHLPAA